MDRLNNDAVGNIISHLHSWKDIFEFHRSNPNLYRKVLSHKCHLPWTIDHHNDRSCLLQNYMATTIATASLSESTIANLFVKLSEYHSINTLNITNCGVVSFRKAKLLISGIADFSRNLDIQLLQSQKSTFEKAKRRNVPPIEENEIKLVIQDRLLAPTPSPAHEQQFQHQGNTTNTTSSALSPQPSASACPLSPLVSSSQPARSGPSSSSPPSVSASPSPPHISSSQSARSGSSSLSPSSPASALASSLPPPVFHSDAIDLNNYPTPKYIEDWANHMKYMEILSGRIVPYVDNNKRKIIGKDIPSCIRPLVTTNEPYYLHHETALGNAELDPTTPRTVDSIQALLKKYASQYVESIVIFGDYCLFITALDAFTHNQPLDVAADGGSYYYETTTAMIKEKSYHGKKFYEASIFIGNLEFLAVGGVFGRVDGTKTQGFLGSSIRGLPKDLQKPTIAKEILTTNTGREPAQQQRMLRQYAKYSADWKCCFYSTFYATIKGFYPVTPLNFDTHTHYQKKGSTLRFHLASFILRCIAQGTARKSDITAALFKTLADKKIQTMIPNITITSFQDFEQVLSSLSSSTTTSSSSSKLVDITNIPSSASSSASVPCKSAYPSYLTCIISTLAKLEKVSEQADTQNNLLGILPLLKPSVLQLLNEGFASAIRGANDSVVNDFSIYLASLC